MAKMRHRSLLLPLLPFLLVAAGCDRLPGSQPESEGSAEDPLANLQITDRNADPAHIQALIAQAMPASLAGAKDPQCRNVRAGAGGSVCGDVTTAGQPPRAFVITPDALAVVASGPKLRFSDPSDFAADAYVRWCATPDELNAIQAEIRRAAADPANIVMTQTVTAAAPEAAAPPGDLPPPPDVPAPAPPRPAAKPAAPPPPADIDSFMNAVRH
jgi:hypothetical protein